MIHNYSFERLDVWQKSRIFVITIYELTTKFPNSEIYGMVSQIRRAAVSISSNIAEGTSRSSLKEQIRFIEIAYGSALEVYCQLISSKDLGFINDNELEKTVLSIREITNKLNALRKSLQQRATKQLNN